jgi:uncharacterized protein YqfB (UPF0267 family)
MGLYSFKPRFTPHIRSGRKKHTIRAKRKDGWVEKPGNTMYLYENVRTKNRVHIDDRECVRVEEIEIFDRFPNSVESQVRVIIIRDGDRVELSLDEKESLARKDGFDDFADMVRYWRAGDQELPFFGHIIYWK